MKQPKSKYHHGDLSKELVKAGMRLVETEGIENFSLREAAREVGVTANATYRHFNDKAALLTSVAANGFELLSNEMQKAISKIKETKNSKDQAIQKFKAVGRAYVNVAIVHPQLFRLMFGSSGHACLVAEKEINGPLPGEILSEILDELVKSGHMNSNQRIGADLNSWSAVHGFALLNLNGPPELQNLKFRKESLESLLDFIIAGMT